MRVIELSAQASAAIEDYGSENARSLPLARGEGEAHAYLLHLGAGGAIGEHEAGFGQMLMVLEGSGWVSGGDGQRHSLAPGQAAFIERGERHAKGSETGMTALMVQVRALTPAHS